MDSPHRRFNQLTGEWVLVSVGRTNRPWQGATESEPPARRPVHDPSCYLCPGSARAGGEENPDYRSTFVFTNDFAALRPDVEPARNHDGLLLAETQAGTCRVICYSPRHDVDLADLPATDVRTVVDLWSDQYAELAATYRWVQIFENRGNAMGASNPHPHGQIWAGDALPVEPAKEDTRQRRHLDETGRILLLDYVSQELEVGRRVVAVSDGWVAVIPFWAVWPFELLLVPTDHTPSFAHLDGGSRDGLAELLSDVLGRYDRVFGVPFPYSMGWHGAPVGDESHWQLHGHIYPPLLRSASVRKWMVGYEMLAEPQRDITAEEIADRLRALEVTDA